MLKTSIHQAPLRLQIMTLRLKPYVMAGYTWADSFRGRCYFLFTNAGKRYTRSSDTVSETILVRLISETKNYCFNRHEKMPEAKSETPLEIRSYWSYRDEISSYDGLCVKEL